MPAPTVDAFSQITSQTVARQTLGASDILASTAFPNQQVIRAVYVCVAGTLAVKRLKDVAFTLYPVTVGQILYGWFFAVGGTGSGSTAIDVILES